MGKFSSSWSLQLPYRRRLDTSTNKALPPSARARARPCARARTRRAFESTRRTKKGGRVELKEIIAKHFLFATFVFRNDFLAFLPSEVGSQYCFPIHVLVRGGGHLGRKRNYSKRIKIALRSAVPRFPIETK